MSLNCRAGDLAVIVRSLDGNVGALVRVIRDSGDRDNGEFWWVCEALQPIRHDGGVAEAGRRVFVADRDIRPIRDNDGEDETLTWAGKPQEVTA